MPPTSVYMADTISSVSIPLALRQPKIIKVNKVPLGISFTPCVTSSGGGFSNRGSTSGGHGDGFGGGPTRNGGSSSGSG